MDDTSDKRTRRPWEWPIERDAETEPFPWRVATLPRRLSDNHKFQPDQSTWPLRSPPRPPLSAASVKTYGAWRFIVKAKPVRGKSLGAAAVWCTRNAGAVLRARPMMHYATLRVGASRSLRHSGGALTPLTRTLLAARDDTEKFRRPKTPLSHEFSWRVIPRNIYIYFCSFVNKFREYAPNLFAALAIMMREKSMKY